MEGSPGWIGDWSPGIGDPTVVGWLTVALYLCASLLCLLVARRAGAAVATREPKDRAGSPASVVPAIARALLGPSQQLVSLPPAARARALWVGLALVLFLLGVNKQLDLQTAVLELGRDLVFAEGWYGARRRFKALFLAVLALGGLAWLRVVFLLARDESRGARAVLVGATVLVSFVVVRAASFEHLDRLFGLELSESPLNAAAEICGICFIIVGTYRVLRSPQASGAR